jgi:hypothetical protein
MSKPKVAFTIEFEEVSETHPPWSRGALLMLYAMVRRPDRDHADSVQVSRELPCAHYLRVSAAEIRRDVEMQMHVDVLRLALGEVE